MTDFITGKELKTALREQTDEIVGILHAFVDKFDERFNKIEKKLSAHDEEFRKLNEKYDHLLNTIDTFLGRIDKYEQEQAARDRQFERLLEWARKVSKKTGIPLENL